MDTATFDIKLRVIVAHGMYTAEVSMPEVDISVAETATSMKEAIRSVAVRCAAELVKRDYATTSADVVEALTRALDQHLAAAN